MAHITARDALTPILILAASESPGDFRSDTSAVSGVAVGETIAVSCDGGCTVEKVVATVAAFASVRTKPWLAVRSSEVYDSEVELVILSSDKGVFGILVVGNDGLETLVTFVGEVMPGTDVATTPVRSSTLHSPSYSYQHTRSTPRPQCSMKRSRICTCSHMLSRWSPVPHHMHSAYHPRNDSGL